MKIWKKILIGVAGAVVVAITIPFCIAGITGTSVKDLYSVVSAKVTGSDSTDADSTTEREVADGSEDFGDFEGFGDKDFMAGPEAEEGDSTDGSEVTGTKNGFFGDRENSQRGGKGMMNPWSQDSSSSTSFASSASEIVYSDMESKAADLSESATKTATIKMSNSNNSVEISEAGIYVITGSCSDGNIKVKKGTTGVVLILKDLTLTSKTGACISINKGSIVKMVIQGTVTLTDAENPDDENSSDEATADAFDGAAIKVKAGADLYITGTGTLKIDASSCKNGIKVNDDATTVCIIDGPTIDITAANDAINAGYDLTILSGKITISAGDDAIHADRILTIGSENTSPVVTINKSGEGLEGSVVNIISGDITVNSTDDAINGGNSDKTYSDEMDFSINILGGTTVITSSGDGLDSNGNINLVNGSLTINCNNNGGEGGIDYGNSCYLSDDFSLTNYGGVTFDSGSGEMGGKGNFGPGNGGFNPRENSDGTFEMPEGKERPTKSF